MERKGDQKIGREEADEMMSYEHLKAEVRVKPPELVREISEHEGTYGDSYKDKPDELEKDDKNERIKEYERTGSFLHKVSVDELRMAQKESEILREKLRDQMTAFHKHMESTKEKIFRTFESIRNAIEQKEAEVLSSLEKTFNKTEIKYDNTLRNLEQARETISVLLSTSNAAHDELDGILNPVYDALNFARYLGSCSFIVSPKTFPSDDEYRAMIDKIGFDAKKIHSHPTNLRVERVSGFAAELKWDVSHLAEEYKLKITMKDPPQDWKQPDAVSLDTNSYTIKSLLPITAYDFAVMAKGARDREECWSEWSQPVTFRTKEWYFGLDDIVEYYSENETCANGLDVFTDYVRNGRMDNCIGKDFARFVVNVGTYHIGYNKPCLSALNLLCEILKKYFSGMIDTNARNETIDRIIRANIEFTAKIIEQATGNNRKVTNVIGDILGRESRSRAREGEEREQANRPAELNADEEKHTMAEIVLFTLDALTMHKKEKAIYESGLNCLKIILEKERQGSIAEGFKIIEVLLNNAKEYINVFEMSKKVWSLIPLAYDHQINNTVIEVNQGDKEHIFELLISSACIFLAAYQANSEVCRLILIFIRNISYNNNMFSKTVAKMDNTSPNAGYSIITRTLSILASQNISLEICEQCLCVLQNLTFDSSDNQIFAGNVGAIQVILQVLCTYVNYSVICFYGCGALRNITGHSGNQKIAGESSAINIVTNILATHLRDANVCYRCCSALWNITMYPPNQKMVGVETAGLVVYAMHLHLQSENVIDKGIGALKSFKWNTDSNRKMIYDSLVQFRDLHTFIPIVFDENELRSMGY